MNRHPIAWWICSGLIAATVLHTSRAWIALGAIAFVTTLVLSVQSRDYWYRSFAMSVKLAAIIFIFRMVIGLIIGVPMPGRTLFRLPEITMPSWLVGIRIGGDVTSQRLLTTLHEALILVSLVVIFGAANSLVSPRRLLNTFPQAFYAMGTALVIATSTVPTIVSSISRIKAARRLRGLPETGFAAWRDMATPLFEESLERAIDLSAAMEARGFGYRKNITRYRPISWTFYDSALIACAAIPLAVFW